MAEAIRAAAGVFVPSQNHSGAPMVRRARSMVAQAAVGTVRVVPVEDAQDRLARDPGTRRSAWRGDPARSGLGGAVADIGTHAYHLAGSVTGLRPRALLAEFEAPVPGRRHDDNAQVLLRYEDGAEGTLWCSQVAPGHGNALRLLVHRTEGGLGRA